MYEVFFNDRKIVIAAKREITINQPIKRVDDLTSVKAVKEWFLSFIETRIREIVLVHSSPEVFFEEVFKPAFKPVPAAGGVVVRNNEILFIFRNNRWDLPKGKVDAGETTREAAVREVAEECGISGHKIVKQIPSTFHIFISPYKNSLGEWIFKETFWFEMEYSAMKKGQPQTEENITEIRWFARNRLNEVCENTYGNLKSIITLYKKY